MLNDFSDTPNRMSTTSTTPNVERSQRGIQTNKILALSAFSIFASHFSSSLCLSLRNRFRCFTWKIWTVTKNSLLQYMLFFSAGNILSRGSNFYLYCTISARMLFRFQVLTGVENWTRDDTAPRTMRWQRVSNCNRGALITGLWHLGEILFHRGRQRCIARALHSRCERIMERKFQFKARRRTRDPTRKRLRKQFQFNFLIISRHAAIGHPQAYAFHCSGVNLWKPPTVVAAAAAAADATAVADVLF